MSQYTTCLQVVWLTWVTISCAGDPRHSESKGEEPHSQEGPYLYEPSEARSARVIRRASSPAQSESSAFSRQACWAHI